VKGDKQIEQAEVKRRKRLASHVQHFQLHLSATRDQSACSESLQSLYLIKLSEYAQTGQFTS
jgi:hypothetical protein